MTTDLLDTLRARADRAPAAPDLDLLLIDVRERADRAQRRRRNLVAAGGGSLVIVALTVGVIAAAPTGRPDSSAPAASTGRTTVDVTPTSDRSAASVAQQQRLQQIERERRAAEARIRANATPGPGLVTVAPAPRSAEVSISLVPADWVLLGSQGPVTLYGPRSLVGTSMNNFEGKLLVSVHERIGTRGTYPLTVAGRPASYQEGNGDTEFQGVDVIVDGTTEVNIQVPPTAGLTRAEIIRLANTLDVRSTAEKTHG